jgi:hypothetical protein
MTPRAEQLRDAPLPNTCPGDHTFGRCDRDDCDFVAWPAGSFEELQQRATTAVAGLPPHPSATDPTMVAWLQRWTEMFSALQYVLTHPGTQVNGAGWAVTRIDDDEIQVTVQTAAQQR